MLTFQSSLVFLPGRCNVFPPMKCIVSTWNKFPALSHVNSFIRQGALLSNMHPSRKQRLFFIFLVRKMAKYRKIRYRSRFLPSCYFKYRLQNNTNLLAGQGGRPSKCRFPHPMALIFLKPPHFHQYPHYINVIEIAMIIMMVLQLLNIVTCGRSD